LQIHVPASGNTAILVPAGSNVINVLKSLGNYQSFLLALQVGCKVAPACSPSACATLAIWAAPQLLSSPPSLRFKGARWKWFAMHFILHDLQHALLARSVKSLFEMHCC
jgi:hypothetical protein